MKGSLSAGDISFLSKYLNPFYLQPKTLKALAERFTEESSIEAHSFLSETIAQRLRTGLRNLDAAHGLGPTRLEGESVIIPPHDAGVVSSEKWTIKGPPHKWRYSILNTTTSDPSFSSSSTTIPTAVPELDPDPESAAEDTLRELQEDLFPSKAFRTWLTCVASLVPLSYAVEARRFRPGLDYTLAMSCEDEFRLDAVLGLTPEVGGTQSGDPKEEEKEGGDEDEVEEGWEAGEWGGWDVSDLSFFSLLVPEIGPLMCFSLQSATWLPTKERTIRLSIVLLMPTSSNNRHPETTPRCIRRRMEMRTLIWMSLAKRRMALKMKTKMKMRMRMMMKMKEHCSHPNLASTVSCLC
jgi:hypothetical protein